VTSFVAKHAWLLVSQ